METLTVSIITERASPLNRRGRSTAAQIVVFERGMRKKDDGFLFLLLRWPCIVLTLRGDMVNVQATWVRLGVGDPRAAVAVAPFLQHE